MRSQLSSFSQKLGTEDRIRVEQHVDSVREVEKQLAGLSNACTKPVRLPDGKNYVREPANPDIPEILRAQIDLAVTAMACDMTRVVSLATSNSNNNAYTFFWLGDRDPGFLSEIPEGEDSGGFNSDGGFRHHHSIAHNEGRLKRMKNFVDQWFIERLAYLIGKLSTTMDPGNVPMIENTVIVFANLQQTGGGTRRTTWPGSSPATGRATSRPGDSSVGRAAPRAAAYPRTACSRRWSTASAARR